EDVKDLLAHFIQAAKLALEPVAPGFVAKFPSDEEIDELVEERYVDAHRRYVRSKPDFEQMSGS
ncbi:MAG: hypothetical protein ACI9HK_004039, partial [Pirellulaceae bacterium]